MRKNIIILYVVLDGYNNFIGSFYLTINIIPHTIPHKHDKNQGKKQDFMAIKNPASNDWETGLQVFNGYPGGKAVPWFMHKCT